MLPPIAGTLINIPDHLLSFEVSVYMKLLFKGIVCCHVLRPSHVARAVQLYSAPQRAQQLLHLSIAASVDSPPCSTR